MCGLFGLCGNGISYGDLRMARDLCMMSSLRGTDSTGIFQCQVSRKGIRESKLVKNDSGPEYFLWFNEHAKDGEKTLLNDIGLNLFLGHTRAATKGKVNSENAHPFELKTIVGAHNGTLWDTAYRDAEKTDSEMMFLDIEKRGLHHVLEGLDDGSAYAISMFDKTTGQLIFATNGKRPLCYTLHEKRNVFYWASEAGALRYSAERNDIDIGQVYEFTPGWVYSFKPHTVNQINKKWNTYKLKPKPKPVYTSNYSRNNRKFMDPFEGVPWVHEQHTNIIALPKPNNIPLEGRTSFIHKKTNELIKQCISCSKDMDLLAQHQGLEVELNKYKCEQCILFDEKDLNVVSQIGL